MPVSFPGSVATDLTLGVAADQASTTLTTSCTSTDTVLHNAIGPVFPAGCIVTIDGEQILLSSAFTGVMNVLQRGYGGTAASSHLAGAAVRCNVSSVYFNNLSRELQATQSPLLNYKVNTGSSFPVPRTIFDRLGDQINVRDFGAKGDGTTDDTAAFQAALNYLSAFGGGELWIRQGIYKLTAQLTLSTCAIRVTGAGSGATYLRWDSPGGFRFIGGAATYQTVLTCSIKGLTLLANCSAAGDALNLSWTASGFNVADYGILDDLRVVNQYQSGAYWNRGIILSNASNFSIRKIWCGFSGVNTTVGILIANSTTVAGFNYTMSEISIEGGVDGIVCTGWAEGISIVNSGAVVAGVAVRFDATGVGAGGAVLQITNTAWNCGTNCIQTTGWRGVYISNSDLFHTGPVSGSGDGTHILCQANASSAIADVIITNCHIEEGNPTLYSQGGIALVNCSNYSINDNVLVNLNAGGIAITGVGNFGTIGDNTILAYNGGAPVGGAGIFIAASNNHFTVSDNVIWNWTNGISISGSGGIVEGNYLLNCITGITAVGGSVDTRGNMFSSVTNPYGASTIGHIEFYGSAVLNLGTIGNSAFALLSATVAGAALGMIVDFAAPYDLQGLIVSAYVQSANTISVCFWNSTGASKTIASGTWLFRLSS